MKRHKYNAKKTVVNGIKFDSKAEANRYCELMLWIKSGDISDLELQPEFIICPRVRFNGRWQQARKYIADFKYKMNGEDIVEDVKGFRTTEYTLKRNLFLSQYPQYTFIETK